MEDDDEFISHPSPTPNGRISVTVAAAPPPPPYTLTLALPIQQQQQQKTPGSSGGGREDCWSEGATAILIDAWSERYLELSRGNLKQQHWKEIAHVVCSRDNSDLMKTPKTDIQCKNRIDTVKKKYKIEKAKIASGAGPSNWRFFDKIDELIGSTSKINSTDANSMYRNVPMGIPVGIRSASASASVPQPQLRQRPTKRRPVESDEDSEQENSGDESDGLPPESYKRPRIDPMVRDGMMNKKSNGGGSGIGDKESSSSNWGNSIREVARAFLKIGEAYEQMESAKLQQLVEMEKQRMKFAKEMELQRMQFFMKTQLELSQLNHRRRGNDNNHRVINHANDVDNNNNNNSDSSN